LPDAVRTLAGVSPASSLDGAFDIFAILIDIDPHDPAASSVEDAQLREFGRPGKKKPRIHDIREMFEQMRDQA